MAYLMKERTKRAKKLKFDCRRIAADRNDMNTVFIQITLEFLTKQHMIQKAVAEDISKEVLVQEIWVFKSLFHTNVF